MIKEMNDFKAHKLKFYKYYETSINLPGMILGMWDIELPGP